MMIQWPLIFKLINNTSSPGFDETKLKWARKLPPKLEYDLTKRSQRKLNWNVVADKNGLENWLLIPVNKSEDRRAPRSVGFQKSPFEYTAKVIFFSFW